MTEIYRVTDEERKEATNTPEEQAQVLDSLSDVLAWADVGQQSAPRGKTVIDINWAGKIIRRALTQPQGGVQEDAWNANDTNLFYAILGDIEAEEGHLSEAVTKAIKDRVAKKDAGIA